MPLGGQTHNGGAQARRGNRLPCKRFGCSKLLTRSIDVLIPCALRPVQVSVASCAGDELDMGRDVFPFSNLKRHFDPCPFPDLGQTSQSPTYLDLRVAA